MKRVAAASGAAILLGAGPGMAADVGWQPRVEAVAVHNDNNRLTDIPGQEIEVSGARFDAQVTLNADTERTNFSLTPRLRSTFYPGEESEEADDQFVRMDWRHATERTRLRLGANYSRVVTFGSYFPEPVVRDGADLGDPDVGVGIGRTFGKNREERIAVRPELRFDLTERHAVEFRVDYVDVGYNVQEASNREDFTSLGGSLGYRWTLSQRQNLLMRANFGRYDPADGDSRDGYGVDGRWSNEISETAETYVRAGVNRVETVASLNRETDWETGFTGGAGVRWAFEVTDIWLDASQYLNPNSSGDLVTRTELSLQVGRDVSPRTRVLLAGRLMQDTGATDSDDFEDSTYATTNLGFEWRWARQWMLVGSYQYQWREFDEAPNDATSNLLNLGVVWQPGRL